MEYITDEEFKKFQLIKSDIYSDVHYGLNFPIKEFIKCMVFLNPQSYGSRIEKRIILDLNGKSVAASEDKGDMVSNSNQYTEIKASLLTGSNNFLNLVQIRPWQDLNYYFLIAFDLLNLDNFKIHAFLLKKEDMLKEIELLNFNSAHGTKKAIKDNKNIEYRYSLKIDESNEIFIRWKKMYGVDYYNTDSIREILEKEK